MTKSEDPRDERDEDEAIQSDPGDAERSESESSEPARAKRPKKRAAKKRAKRAQADPPGAAARDPKRSAPAQTSSGWRAILFAAVALLAGAALGWFLRDAQAGGALSAGPDPAASAAAAGSAGPCGSWSSTICEKAGAESEGCMQAKSAAALLPASACNQAMSEVPATLAKLKEARSSCDALMAKLCADLGNETETCGMVKEKTPGMPARQCKDMLDNYDRVIGELRQLERQNAPITAAEAAKQAAGEGPSFGPADAKVVIVEYSDFECPFCSRAAETVNKLKKRYGEVVRFVFRQYPLPMHPNAQVAAEASLAAHAQGKFWAFHDLMFANQRQLDRESLEGYAKEAGLDLAKFKKALDDHTYAQAVKDDMALGQELGVQGTPTMIVGTERIANPTDYASVSAKIDAQLKAAGVAVPPEVN